MYILKNLKLKLLASLMMICLLVLFSSCDNNEEDEPVLAVGDEGVEFAIGLSGEIPFRQAYSEQEKLAAEKIESRLVEMGYEPEVVTFGEDDLISRNIILRIPGEGFVKEGSLEEEEEERIFRQAVIGAHYDTPVGIEQEAEFLDYDGIQDNASGVGALMSIAKEIKEKTYEYDIVIVFFGAGHDDFAGARNFVESMDLSDIEYTDVMYCIESIYAGDKIYAHAGTNSLEEGKKYIRRRKLYELSDVAIANRIDLRFNQSDLDVDVTGDGEYNVYREVTLTKSDHTPFDELGIACVFIESFEYFASSVEEQVESRNPHFHGTGGMIRGTEYDSTVKLSEVLEESRLETRIKNVVFLIVKALEMGIYTG